MKKSNLEVFQELTLLEQRKEHFKALKNDVNDYYFNEGFLHVDLMTNQFEKTRKYNGEKIKIDKVLFEKYLQNEIDELHVRIAMKLEDLMKGD